MILTCLALVLAVAPLIAWLTLGVHRQVRLYRMQRCAAWNWEMDRSYRHLRHGDDYYRAQAEHLDRHIRSAREGSR